MYETDQSRSQCIRDLLIGVSDRYRSQDVLLRPILDGLILFNGVPHCLSFFTAQSGGPRLLFTTMEDHELQQDFLTQAASDALTEDSLAPIPKTDFHLALHRIRTLSESSGLPNIGFEQTNARPVCNLLSRLEREPSYLGKPAFEGVRAFLAEKVNANPAGHSRGIFPTEDFNTRRMDLSGFDRDSLWRRLRDVIDQTFATVEHASLLTTLNGQDTGIFNLFCVVRTATNFELRRRFNYTAQVVLSGLQSSQIGDKDLVERVQTPLGTSARSIADSVFCSGVIDFSDEVAGKGRDLAGHSEADILRHQAENEVYRRITAQPNTFYIPVHVSGVPWLALFTLSPKSPENSNDSYCWSRNYHIYREIVPKVADGLRRGVRKLYLELLSDDLARHFDISAPRHMLAKVNSAWNQLSYFFPYPRATLSLQPGSQSKHLVLPNGLRVWISLEQTNPHFVRQLPYDLLSCDEVGRACDEIVKAEMQQAAIITEQDHARAQFLRHTMINHFPLTSLEAALAQPDSQMSGKARQHVEDARKLFETVNVALAFVTGPRQREHYPLEGLSLGGILRWLQQQRLDCEALPEVIVDEDADWIPANQELPDVFTILLNFWENCGKHAPKKSKNFTVRVNRVSDEIRVKFSNPGSIPPEWRSWLLGEGDSPNKSSVRKGLEIALASITKLHWQIASVLTDNSSTVIEIAIPTRSQMETRL